MRQCEGIKDIDFERTSLIVRAGKGDKDRLTVLPESLKNDLREHMERARELFEKDRKEDVAGVYCSNHDDLYPCGPEERTGGQEPVGSLTALREQGAGRSTNLIECSLAAQKKRFGQHPVKV
jgi:hypothetical protein